MPERQVKESQLIQSNVLSPDVGQWRKDDTQ